MVLVPFSSGKRTTGRYTITTFVESMGTLIIGETIPDLDAPLPENLSTASSKLNKLISRIRIGPVANRVDRLSKLGDLGFRGYSPAGLYLPP